MKNPTDLTEALSVLPLLHLIPQQQNAAIITPPLIHSLDDSEIRISAPPQNLQALTEEICTLDDPELDELRFLPQKTDSSERVRLSLDPFQKRIFDRMAVRDPVPVEALQYADISRLSVRKDYSDSTQEHNRKYARKFQKELRKNEHEKKDQESKPSFLGGGDRNILKYEDKEVKMGDKDMDKLKEVDDMEKLMDNVDKGTDKLIDKVDKKDKDMVMDELIDEVDDKVIDKEADNMMAKDMYKDDKVDDKVMAKDTDMGIVKKDLDKNMHMHPHMHFPKSGYEDLKVARKKNPLLDFPPRKKACVAPDPTKTKAFKDLEGFFANGSLSLKHLESILSSLFMIQDHSIISDLDVDHLLHLQEFCQNTIIDANLEFAPTAGQILMIILGNRWLSDRRLFVGDYLDTVTEFAAKVARDTVKETERASLGGFGSLLNAIAEHIKTFSVDEHILTRLEYLSTLLIFTESPNAESVRSCAVNVLAQIYIFKEDQREFIIGEIVANIDKLPVQKTRARQFRLTRGGNIQYITLLLVTIVEGFCAKRVRAICESMSETNKKDYGELFTEGSRIWDGVIRTSQELAAVLIQRLYSADSQFKAVFEILVEDLVNTVAFPEFPGSEMLLVSLWKGLLLSIKNETCGAQEAYFLEMAGMIGERILRLRSGDEVRLSEDVCVAHCNRYREDVGVCVGFLASQAQKTRSLGGSMRVFCTSILVQLSSFFSERSEQKEQKELFHDETSEKKAKEQRKALLPVLKTILSVFCEELSAPPKSNFEQSVSAYTNILMTRELNETYERFLSILLSALESTKVKSKTRALKVLSSLMEHQPHLISSPYFQKAISNRMTDTSPLVRDAVIDLVSRYLGSKPGVLEGFYHSISGNLNDSSVSVRKRVLGLMREMYVRSESKHMRVDIGSRVLSKIDGETRDMAVKFLVGVWFEDVEKQVDVIAEVAYKGAKQMVGFFSVAQKSVECVRTIVGRVLETVNELPDDQAERYLHLVALLAKMDGKAVSQDQLISLMPYLSSKGSLCLYTLQVLRCSFHSMKSMRPDHLDAIHDYLLQNLTKFSVAQLQEAVPCAWRASEMKNSTVKITNATVSTLRLLRPYLEKTPITFDPKLQKLLHLLGCFGKYCRFEQHRALFSKAVGKLKEKESVVSMLVKFVMYFCDASADERIRVVAVMNLISICSAHPRLFMSEPILGVFDDEFAKDNLTIIYSIIQGLLEFVVSEDVAAEKRSKKTTDKIDIGVFHGNTSDATDSICASLVHRYTRRINQLCLIDNGAFSQLPIKFLQAIVQMGYANPKVCISTILALESSRNPAILSIAKDLHQEIYNKHESLAGNSYVEAIKLAVAYRKKVSPMFLSEDDYFSTIYAVLRSTSSKKKFVSSIVKVLSLPIKESFDRDLVFYSLVNMAKVRYETSEEVAVLAKALDDVISTQGMDLLEYVNAGGRIKEEVRFSAQAYCAMMRLREKLGEIEEYRPGKKVMVDVEDLGEGDGVVELFVTLMSND